MPDRKQALITGEYYLIYNKQAEKKIIFLTSDDYSRFVLLLEVLNAKQITNTKEKTTKDISLVEIIAFTLTRHSFHIIVKQKTHDGISKFMQKVLTGYTMYFNAKYERTGSLFTGPFCSHHIQPKQLKTATHNIHFSPTKNKEAPEQEGISLEELAQYPWSSLGTFMEISKPPPFLKKEKISEIHASLRSNQYKNEFKDFLMQKLEKESLTDTKEENQEKRDPNEIGS